MKGPFYSVGPIKNVVLYASDVTDFINEVRDVLLSCNWTLVSSSTASGGTPTYILKSYPTPLVYNQFRVRLILGETNYVYFYISDENGDDEQFCGGITIHPNKQLRCLAGPHQFFIFLDLSIYPVPAFLSHNNVMAGCPNVVNEAHSQVFWGQGDIGFFTTAGSTFRDRLAGGNFSSFLINDITPWTGTFPDLLGNTANCFPTLLSQRGINLDEPVLFPNNNAAIIEPILVMGRVPNNYYSATLWDAMVVSKPFSVKQVVEMDGYRWESFTLSIEHSVVGCLFLVTERLETRSVGSYAH